MKLRQPAYFIFHGGGPSFFMDWEPPKTWDGLRLWLEGIINDLPQRPDAILVVTAHWEASSFQFSVQPSPTLLYDYYGFPPHTYQLRYDAPSAAPLAEQANALLKNAHIPSQIDRSRGWDHGVFIPLKVMRPEADIPVLAMSLREDMNPSAHIEAGKALEKLRDENILIIGSGASYHNLRAWLGKHPSAPKDAALFDAWLTQTLEQADSDARDQALIQWTDAPSARQAHPREEHLLPLMVVAGAANHDVGKRVYHENIMGIPFSGYRFG